MNYEPCTYEPMYKSDHSANYLRCTLHSLNLEIRLELADVVRLGRVKLVYFY